MSRALDHITSRVRVVHADFFPFGPPQEPSREVKKPVPTSLDDPNMGVYALDSRGYVIGWRPLDLAERFELYGKSPRSHGRVSW